MVNAILTRAGCNVDSFYCVEKLTEPEAIRPWLELDQDYAAYAVSQLEPRLFQYSEWWAASGKEGWALVVTSRTSIGNAIITLGDAEALDAILSLHPGPGIALGTFQPEHLAVARRHYLLSRQESMLRMAVTTDSFQPVKGEVCRLKEDDISSVNRLYASENWPSSYKASVLREGIYYGVFVDGELVSVAGTHAVSPSEGVALVGNVFTHSRYRKRGLATLATSAVTGALLEICPRVLLTVENSNPMALRVYSNLGYREVCTFHEASVMRRDPSGLFSLARRLVAGWRGRSQGIEIVYR